jgi:4-alpha-glucanotransferase
VDGKNITVVMAELLYASVAKVAILPMQDILHLDERARLNQPAKGSDNWQWRLKDGQLTPAIEKWLCELAKRYNRL